MSLPVDTVYGSSRIPIPSDLPEILKQFTKAAIRTQPRDVLQWSVAYFHAIARGVPPPVKERIEFVPSDNETWITLGLLRVLHRQLGDKEQVSFVQIQSTWNGLCLDPKKLNEITEEGNFTNRIHWITFLAIVCNLATKTVADALRFFCEVVTREPEGCPARVPYNLVSHVYLTIVERNGNVSTDTANNFVQYLADCSESQDNFVHPGNFLSPACPPLS